MAEPIIITEAEVASFVARAQNLVNEYVADNFDLLVPSLLTFDYASAKKFCRIVTEQRFRNETGEITIQTNSRSCWGFIDLTNGDVLKSDGWKKPAKHARGNIRDDRQGMGQVSANGPAYLK